MKKLFFLLTVACCIAPAAFSQTFSIRFTPSSPQQAYAAAMLQRSLQQKGYKTSKAATAWVISLTLDSNAFAHESYILHVNPHQIQVTGGDERGLIYGSLSLAEDIRNGVPLSAIHDRQEKPYLALRAIKFDLPWDTYRHSYALDLHGRTCKDTAYWRAFLDMMVENRFNSLSLWNLHPYPYLIKAKNFPEASPFTDAEMKKWQTLFHTIFRMAKERAIDTYIIPFNIFVTPQFAKAHNVAMDNLQHDFFVRGDTSEIIKKYTRECVTQLLDEYPELTGIGLTLGEAMAGMIPEEREEWMHETIIEGMRLAHRTSKLVHRIPFSSTTSSLGITSIETERLTRRSIESEAAMDFIEGPVWADLKFNWSHAHSTTKLIKVHGGKLYDTYFNPVPEKYKITWTARNEDFFCLRWGVPSFVRAHILANSQPYVGGYFIGSETYIPAKDYFTKDSTALPWRYAFERQWLFYKIWGRLLYDPSSPDTLFAREFTRRYGKQAATLLQASSLAGMTPLRLGSLFDFTWDFSLYSEGMMALDSKTKRVDYISVDHLINQPVTDPDYVNIADYVRAAVKDSQYAQEKITPLLLAHFLENDCNKALALTARIQPGKDKSLLYEVADIRVWSYLGLHLAEKLRGAVALQTYRVKRNERDRQQAILHLTKALRWWDMVISITKPLYREMPLVQYSEQDSKPWQENDHLRFHWEKLLQAVAKDILLAEETK